MKHHVQTKAREREKIKIADSNNNSDEKIETDENDSSSAEVDVDNRFGFTRRVPDEIPMQKQNMREWKKRGTDAIDTKMEFERASSNWIERKVK